MIRFLIPLVVLLLAGCPRFGYHPHPLRAYSAERCAPQPNHVLPCDAHASMDIRPAIDGDTFVGLSISGGGLRAANFGAAVLLELKHILPQVDVISANSGGSVAAALLALDGYQDPWRLLGTVHFFDTQETKERLRVNLQFWYVLSWLSPFNMLATLLTTYNRTDIMYYAFDDYVFGGATYADIARLHRDARAQSPRPRILINATDKQELQDYLFKHGESGGVSRSGERFVFSEERFRALGADLSRLPVSVAVTASAAVPGLYNTATLRSPAVTNGRNQHLYLHLMDGMLTDDLAAGTLLDLLRHHLETRAPTDANWGRCLLIAIDASPRFDNRWTYQDETREFYKDYLIDRNMSDMAAYILLSQRKEWLEELGFTEDAIERDEDRVTTLTIPDPKNNQPLTCNVWHIALRHIPVTAKDEADHGDQAEDAIARRCAMYRVREDERHALPACHQGPPAVFTFGQRLAWIPTEFDITTCQQEDLFAAARRLVDDAWPEPIRRWFWSPSAGGPPTPTPATPAGRVP